MTKKILIPVLLAALVVLATLTGCHLNSESKGREGILDVSYETVTNKLLSFKPTPAAAGIPALSGPWNLAGQSCEYEVDEGPQGDVSGTFTSVVVTRVDSKSTSVQVKTTKLGPLLNTRDRQIEKQRWNELSQLLAK
jgi:hypothetical protein